MPETPLRHITNRSGPAPFLKWPGGKRWLLRQGLNVPVLEQDATYYEPFLGAASLFFALQPGRAHLTDLNADLIATYRALRTQTSEIIQRLQGFRNDRGTYERIRASSPTLQLDRAVRILYLNRTAFAGLYRENASGRFNVPFGNYTDRVLCQEQVLRDAAVPLAAASVHANSFHDIATLPVRGDFVYLDPPYILGHHNNGFVRYNGRLFTWEAQVELAALARSLVSRGVHVLISNAAHADVLALYDGFFAHVVDRRNQVSRKPQFRGITREALLSSYPGPMSVHGIMVRSRSRYCQ